ncbi:hypothetical protein PV394_03300, partial [Streptomyces sp. NE06-03E]|uniref:hypothetical protein n=1 Tax=Streptomyces sp. NE06-03E TaxID=3028695 RepID=UPI0029AD9F66
RHPDPDTLALCEGVRVRVAGVLVPEDQTEGAVAAALSAHGLRSHAWPVTHVVTELIAVNAALTPGRDLYLSLRRRDGTLRLVLRDQHPRHPDPDTLALCEVRRRRALWLLAAVVDDWGGDWGLRAAQAPDAGVTTWVVLPQ